ncbi:MAG: hypothetical protein H6855_05650 [Rhodospirillales bacterium]|nr:hypothetical protein [Rhodospirillales bacterium]
MNNLTTKTSRHQEDKGRKTSVEKWFSTMKEIWLSQDPDLIAEIISDTPEYYENPFEPPLTTKEDVVGVWQDIKSQKIDFVKIDILYQTDKVGMAMWKFKETDKPLHIGSYYLELDQHGKCSLFRQWWNSAD